MPFPTLASALSSQVARGYLDDPSLTAAKFSVDEAGVRWFRTGDVARRTPRGLVLCGRLDHQVCARV
jgi:non-ribosomal peptide synthetase component F